MARLVQVLVAPAKEAPMERRDAAVAVPGRGLEGDRYWAGLGTFSPAEPRPDFEVTLVEREKVEAFAAASGLPFDAAMARRNLVTEGIDLNALVGREFLVGGVRLRGIRLCEPCAHLARVAFPELLRGWVHQGGLRAAVVSGGTVHVGDAVVPCLPEARP